MSASPLAASLLVTVIGMVVVFIAMALFYASMRLLATVARDRVPPGAASVVQGRDRATGPVDDTGDGRSGLRAAAAAVALARARLSAAEPSARPDEERTPWGEFYRQRQLRPFGRGRGA